MGRMERAGGHLVLSPDLYVCALYTCTRSHEYTTTPEYRHDKSSFPHKKYPTVIRMHLLGDLRGRITSLSASQKWDIARKVVLKISREGREFLIPPPL